MILGKSMSHLLKASYNQELRNPPEGAREVGGLDRDSPELGVGGTGWVIASPSNFAERGVTKGTTISSTMTAVAVIVTGNDLRYRALGASGRLDQYTVAFRLGFRA